VQNAVSIARAHGAEDVGERGDVFLEPSVRAQFGRLREAAHLTASRPGRGWQWQMAGDWRVAGDAWRALCGVRGGWRLVGPLIGRQERELVCEKVGTAGWSGQRCSEAGDQSSVADAVSPMRRRLAIEHAVSDCVIVVTVPLILHRLHACLGMKRRLRPDKETEREG
jgi:hypothetical protein